ncbi:response regulator [Spongisporangium articulatum]|uniref:Response regulator n=1 Tax=Spongisporangium articulatum TaxID=3362603 RepID=A0ABW8AS53_9ACTN
MTDVVSVLVADDHRLFRDGVKALLAVTGGIEVVGEAADAPSAVALTLQTQPDVVLMDLQMPGGGGLAATAELAEKAPGVAVLVLTMAEDDESLFTAVRSGARGYVLKDSEAEDLVRAIRAAARGEAIFGASVAGRLLGSVGGRRGCAEPFGGLTSGERNVLRLMAQGLSNGAIAQALSISDKTVRNYVSSVFRKLDVPDRAQAIVAAREAGLHRDG